MRGCWERFPSGAEQAVERALAQRVGAWSERVVPTAGLLRGEHDELLDLVAAEVRPGERYGWLGLSSELAPAVLILGVHARGGSPTRVFEEARRDFDVTPTPSTTAPVGWSSERLAQHVRGLDLVFMTDPPDVKGRADRAWVRELLQRPLIDELDWSAQRIGSVPVTKPSGEVLDLHLFACRPPRK